MSDLIERLYITAYANGLGEKKARGSGSVGIEKTKDGVKFSIGRSNGSYYGQPLATAWASMTKEKAHELAMAILYLTGGPMTCQGECIKVDKHNVNLSVDISFKVDLCTILNKNREDLIKEVTSQVANKIANIELPGIKKTEELVMEEAKVGS